ncbi:MAG: hypothetical protein K9N10_04555 [Deltaproteobacteria bacterium]|nr:hypothetical protein [Deltaproteobacteria bacterium]
MAFSFVFPFLLMMALCQRALMMLGRSPKGWGPALAIASVSGLLVILPIGGLPVGRWLISLYANPSIPITALLFSWIIKNSFNVKLLDPSAIQTCRIFSLVAGAALYPMALGVGTFDPYSAGWHFSWLFVILLAITLALVFFNNRFSMVLLATILAYNLHLLESDNLWDYLVDPLLVIISIAGLAQRWVTIYFLHNFATIRRK